MEWTPEKLAKVRALLSEDSAVLVQKGAVAFGTGTAGARRIRQKIVRQWPRISDGDRALCDAYLLEYASAANTTPGNIVHGPKTDRETFTGDWRMTRTDLSRIKTDSREQGCYQTLIFPADASDGPDGSFPSEETHLNHVHTTVSTGSAPAEIPCKVPPQGTRLSAAARLDRETGEWESEVRTDQARPQEWDYYDEDALSTTKHTRAEHASAPPSVTPSEGKVVRTHANINEYGTFTTQVDETTPIAGEAPVEAAEWSEKTTSLAYRNADAPKSAIEGVDDPHAIVPSATAHKNEFGKYDGSVQVSVPVEQQSGPYTVEQNALRKVESTFHFNKEPGSVPAASTANGVSTTFHTRVNRFGLLDVEERKTSSGTEGTNRWHKIYPAEWWTETVYTMEFRNWTDVPKKEAFGASEALASFGVLSNHNVNYNDLGLFDGYLILTVPVEQQTDEVVIEDTDLRRVTVQNFFNQRAKPADATSSDGTVTTYHAQKNRFGLWDYEKRTTTYKAKDGTKYTSEDAFFESTETQQKFNQADPEQAKKTSGTIQTVANRLNEAGLYDTEKRTETAEAQQTDEITIENSPERTVTIQHFHNQATKPPDVSQYDTVTDGIQETSYSGLQLNRFGLWDYTKVTTTHKGGRGSGTEWSWTVTCAKGRGVRQFRSFERTNSKGETYTVKLVWWDSWHKNATTTVKKHNTYQDAVTALGTSTSDEVTSAHIESGGGGIFFSVRTTVTDKIWASQDIPSSQATA